MVLSMLSTIPNVKRAEISSSSAKSTSQTRSQHSTINVSEANKTLNASIECLATSYPNDTKETTNLGGISEERQETSIANELGKTIKDDFNYENCANGKGIEVAKNTNNERNSCSATNSSSNLSDMSRRKQRNPKPTLFASFEDNDCNKNPENMQVLNKHNDERCASDRTDIDVSDYDKRNDDENMVNTNIRNVGDNNEGKGSSTYSSPRSSSSPTPPPHDLSSMVKVEVHEGTAEIRAPNVLSPLGKDKEVRSSLDQAQHQNLLHHSSVSRSGSISLPTLTPMPTQQRPLLMSNLPLTIPPGAVPEPQIPPGACTSLGPPLHLSKLMMNSASLEMAGNVGMSKDDINMVSKQNNMFHFGDVSVAHHPDTAPVPMIIPMVYLYPLPPSIDKTEKREVKYRMFVPLGGGGVMDGNPLISQHNQPCTNPLLQNVRPELKEMLEIAGANPLKDRSSSQTSRGKNNQMIVGNSKKETTIPLDLTKSQSTEESEFFRRSSLSPVALIVDDSISNKNRHASGNSEGSQCQDKNPLSLTLSQIKNKQEHSPVTDTDQRTASSSLSNMIPPLIPPLPGVITEGMLSVTGNILPQQEAILKMQQKEFEAQLNFLKSKHLEFIKSQQQMQRQPINQPHPQSHISRCEECNINFSKHQNYVAHKKYYCAANSGKTNPPPTPMQIVSDNDDEELPINNQPNHQQQSPRVPTPKKEHSPTIAGSVHRSAAKSMNQRTPSVSPSASICSNQSIPTGVSAMAMQAAAQAAINNFLAMSSMPGKDNTGSMMNGPTKELLLLKQQELLNKDNILSKEAALHALKAAAAASSNSSHQDSLAINSNIPDSSSPSPQDKLLMCTSVTARGTSKTPPSGPLSAGASHLGATSGMPLTHFCCEGCGIKFKSVSNLQAHQARYCAGLRKSSSEEGGIGNPFETMIKRMTTQQPPPQGQTVPSLPPSHLMSGIQADMMSFLNARSLEQQLQQAEAMKAAVASANISESSEKEDVNPPTAGPAAMAAMAAAISAANAASGSTSNGVTPGTDNVGGNDDYCCILCGYKESSVERLKDHINMHFIGHVKKPLHQSPSPHNGNMASEDSTVSNVTLKSKSPQISPQPTERLTKRFSNGKENGVEIPTEPKRIKLEGPTGTNSNRGKTLSTISPPVRGKTTDIRESISPKTDSQLGPTSILSPKSNGKKCSSQQELSFPNMNDSSQGNMVSVETTPTTNNMRCTACDIGFSQMSNFLAHKKYYCRGLLATSPASLDIKLLPSGDNAKSRVFCSQDKEEDESSTSKM